MAQTPESSREQSLSKNAVSGERQYRLCREGEAPAEPKPARQEPHPPHLREPEVRPIQRAKKPAKPISADWTTMASTYTHDQDGHRVDQYALAVEPQSMERPDYTRSGYRSTRSSLQAGFSADHYQMTEQWGQPVQPYGQWRYPFRPFSVPYGQWGPQLPQVVVGGNQWNALGQRGFNPGLPGNGNFVPGLNGPVQQGIMPGSGGGPISQWQTAQSGFGNNVGNGQWSGPDGGMQGGFGVGPANVLPAGQDEFYPQAPTYFPLTSDGFQSPFRD